MYRDNRPVITHDDHRFLLTHGALGDMICSLPAIIHARSVTPDEVKMTAYVPGWQVDFVRHLLEPYGKITVESIESVPVSHEERLALWGDGVATSMNAPAFNTHTRNRVSMVDFAFNFLIDARPESMLQRSYPTAAPLGPRTIADKYVVIPTGATTDNKLFKAHVMAPIIEWCMGRGCLPVLVGTKESRTKAHTVGGKLEELVIRDEVGKLPERLLACCLDLREQTTLIELRALCGHAEAVVGVDGGTLHVAGTTDTNIVYASGTTLPVHRYIARNGDPEHKIRYVGPRDLECTGCQSRWLMSRWDFRFCAYEDNACMDRLHPDDFIEALKQLGL